RRLGRDDVVAAPVERAAGAEPTDGPVRTLPLLLDAVEDPAGRLLLLRRREALERAEHPRHLLESLGPRSLRPLGNAALRRLEPGLHPEEELAVHLGGKTAGDPPPEDPPLGPVGLLGGVLHALLEEFGELLHAPGVEGGAVT